MGPVSHGSIPNLTYVSPGYTNGPHRVLSHPREISQHQCFLESYPPYARHHKIYWFHCKILLVFVQSTWPPLKKADVVSSNQHSPPIQNIFLNCFIPRKQLRACISWHKILYRWRIWIVGNSVSLFLQNRGSGLKFKRRLKNTLHAMFY